MLRTALAICLTLTLWTVSGAAAHSAAGRAVLAVSVAGGSGTISSSDGRIDCGSQCTASYRKGSIRKLTASPAEGFDFVRWEGDCIGTAPICDLALDRAQEATASFVAEDRLLSLSVSGPGRVLNAQFSISCGGADGTCGAVVPYGTTVTLTPEAAAGGRFAGWDGPCAAAGTGPCTLTIQAPVEISAAFGHLSPPPGDQPLTATVYEGAHITSEPPGIDCLPTCSAQFPSGTLVTLTRDAQSQWIAGCWGIARCRLVVDSPTSVAAATPPPPPIPARATPPPPPPVVAFVDATVSGKGLLTGSRMQCGRAPNPRRACHDFISPGGIYTVRAIRRKGTYFARWGGECRGRKPLCRITFSGSGVPSYSVTGLFRIKR